MNAIELLTKQHREVETLFAKVDKEDLTIVRQIQKALNLHALIEEEYFYPELRNHSELKPYLQHVKEEHDRVRELLTKWAASTGLQWENIAKELEETVTHHVEEEETELFPQVKEVVLPKVLDEIGKRMLTEIPA